jgi:3-hydroxyisobutyrate dehydrogenase
MKIGFIGLGNAGAKLAGSLQRNGFDLIVRDLDVATANALLDKGAECADTCQALAQGADLIITCPPSPGAVSEVMEADDGVIAGLGPGKIWLEMSTTDEAEELGYEVIV